MGRQLQLRVPVQGEAQSQREGRLAPLGPQRVARGCCWGEEGPTRPWRQAAAAAQAAGACAAHLAAQEALGVPGVPGVRGAREVPEGRGGAGPAVVRGGAPGEHR